MLNTEMFMHSDFQSEFHRYYEIITSTPNIDYRQSDVVRAVGSRVSSDFDIRHPNHMNDAVAVLTDKYNAVLVLLHFYGCKIIYSTNFKIKETTLYSHCP